MSAHRVFSIALALVLLACGDDGGTSDTESNGSSGTSGGATTPDPTNASTATPATSGDGSSSGGATEDGASEGSGGGSGDGGSGSADSGDGTAGTGADTGAAGPCAELEDMKTCEGDKGCLWLGNPQNGACIGAGSEVCETLDAQPACNMHPACAWDNAAGACGPA